MIYSTRWRLKQMKALKEIFVKYISKLLIILTVAGIAVFGYSLWRDAQEERKYADLIGTKEKYEQLTKYTAKLETKYETQKEVAKRAKREFKEYKKSANERIKVLSDATYLIGRHVEKQNGPDYYYETPRATRNYVLNEIRLQGKDSPAIGYILIKNDGRTYKRNYKFEVNVKNLQTIDEETGRVKVISKAFMIQKEVSPLKKRIEGYDSWHNKPYPLEITGGVAFVDPTEPDVSPSMWWWAPHINGGLSLGAGGSGAFMRPHISFSTSGYGISRNDLEWKFLHFGLDTDTELKKPGISFMPASYRFWPSVLTNTYLGAGVGYTEDGMNYQLNLNVTF